MIALAQGSAGLALVMGFALLATGQVTAAAALLAVQSGAVAVTAVVLHQPLMAVPPLILGAWTWRLQHETPDPRTSAVGGVKPGIALGAVLAILCQSLGSLAQPSAMVLLSILLAATRSHRSMQVVALVALQNGVALAGSLVGDPDNLAAGLLFPLACLIVPLPLAAGLLMPALSGAASFGFGRAARWLGWIDLGLAVAMAAATLIAPLDPLALVFAPLLALDGVVRSWMRRRRGAATALRRGTALAQTGFTVLAVCMPDLTAAWLAVLGALAMALFPTLPRRWDGAVLAFVAAGLALFGTGLLSAAPPVLGWFSLFAGFATMAAVVPELAGLLAILVLRLAAQGPWPPGAGALGIGIAVIALLACAALLVNRVRSHRTTLLVLSQASIAVLSICTGQAGGRFAALVLLILLILCRAAVRITAGAKDGPAATLAVAGLGGILPFGLFPGLLLVVLVLSGYHPWLVLPLGAALLPIALTGPSRQADFSFGLTMPSIAWLPLVLAILTGYFAPEGLVHWWRLLAAGSP